MEGTTGETVALAKGKQGVVPLEVWKRYRAKSEPGGARPDYEPVKANTLGSPKTLSAHKVL